MSSRVLDVLLAQVREPEPVDDGFVASVMSDIENLVVAPSTRMSALRRPVVAITATAVVLTGGAVAALVGSQMSRDQGGGSARNPQASVSVSAGPEVSADRGTAGAPNPVADDSDVETAIKGDGHTVSVVDPDTGLRLETETYTNEFRTGTPHKVSLTLSNTGPKPLAITGYRDCSQQVMSFPMRSVAADEEQTPTEYYDQYRNQSGVEWVCAGSDTNPRTPTAPAGSIVLRPGESHSSDALLTLPSNGFWGVMGMCRCDVTEAAAPAPKANPFGDFTKRVLPSPLITLDFDNGEGLLTPPIRVRATS